MDSLRPILFVLVLMTLCLFCGCGGGGAQPATETPVGLTQAKKDELTAKFKAEAKRTITKENAEKALKDLEAEIAADPEP